MSARPYENKGRQVHTRKRRTFTLEWRKQVVYYGGGAFRGTTYAYVVAVLNDRWAATLVAGSAAASDLKGTFDNHSHAIVGENFASEGAAKEACRVHFENLMRAQLKGKKQLVRCVCKEIPQPRAMVDAEFVSRGLDDLLAALDSKPARLVSKAPAATQKGRSSRPRPSGTS